MPVVLDPWQYVTAVNWGGLHAFTVTVEMDTSTIAVTSNAPKWKLYLTTDEVTDVADATALENPLQIWFYHQVPAGTYTDPITRDFHPGRWMGEVDNPWGYSVRQKYDDPFTAYPEQYDMSRSSALFLVSKFKEYYPEKQTVKLKLWADEQNNNLLDSVLYPGIFTVKIRTYKSPSESGEDEPPISFPDYGTRDIAYGNLRVRHDAWLVWDFENVGYGIEAEQQYAFSKDMNYTLHVANIEVSLLTGEISLTEI